MHYKLHKNKHTGVIQRITRNLKILTAAAVFITIVGGRFVIGQAVLNDANTSGTLPRPNSGLASEIPPSDRASLSTIRPVQASVSEKLQRMVNSTVSEHDATIAVHISALDGSFSADINTDKQFKAASLYKTLAVYKVLQRVDAGELSLTDTKLAGQTLETCIELAITVSDNPCGVALQSYADPFTTDIQLQEWGYINTTLSGFYPITSAQDQHVLFKDIYEGNRLSDESRTMILKHLANQKILNRTPVYDDATLYLKTGNLDGEIHSSALVETNDTVYTISILTSDWDADVLSKYSVISDIHSQTHEMITQQ